jgi:hypothetical protein
MGSLVVFPTSLKTWWTTSSPPSKSFPPSKDPRLRRKCTWLKSLFIFLQLIGVRRGVSKGVGSSTSLNTPRHTPLQMRDHISKFASSKGSQNKHTLEHSESCVEPPCNLTLYGLDQVWLPHVEDLVDNHSTWTSLETALGRGAAVGAADVQLLLMVGHLCR